MPDVDHSSPEPPLTLLPEVEVRAVLSDRALRFLLLRPPYPALGIGVLRVLRIAERDERTEVVAGYEGYERLEAHDPPAGTA